MKKQEKESGNKPNTTEKIVLVTAVLELVHVIIELIKELLE